MRRVATAEPPSKRRKLVDSSMAEPLAPESIGSKGIKKVEFVKLIAESLLSLGYKDTCAYLELESEIEYASSAVTKFTQLILDGNWDESLNALKQISILDDSVVKSSSFVILEQKFFELLNDHKVHDALRTLRTEISPLSVNQNRVRDLASLVLLLSSGEDEIKPKSRSEVLECLLQVFPRNVMIPQGRLLQLVEQALYSQQDACLFHNSLTGDSLFIDHNCGRTQIPSKTLQILQEHQDEVWCVQFSHNGKFLASCSKDKSTIIWDVSLDGRLVFKHRLTGHKAAVCCVSWSPNNDQVLTCGVEETVRRWDVSSGECVRVYGKKDHGMVSCNWSPDGEMVFCGLTDKAILMWDLESNDREYWVGKRTLRISDLQLTNDGMFIVSICEQNAIAIFRCGLEGERLIKEDDNIVSFVLSDDNNLLLVSLQSQEIHLWRIDGCIRVVARYKGRKCERFVVRACFGGVDQAFVASGSEDSRVYIWYRDTGELLETLIGHSAAVNCTSWNPVNPHMLVSGSDDRTIRVWGLNHVA